MHYALMSTQFAPMAADLPGLPACCDGVITTIFRPLNNLVAILSGTLAEDLLGRFWFRRPARGPGG